MTETLIPTWVETAQAGFVVGDRIKFTCEEQHYGVEGIVRSAFTYLYVQRDDGRRGGGDDGTWWVTEEHNGPLYKQSALPEGYEPPARAVFCVVCGNATGEITNTAPTSKFCVQCRALPALYDYGGEPQGGLVNTDDGRGRLLADRHLVAERMRATGAGQHHDQPFAAPRFGYDPATYAARHPEDDEPEPHDPLVCLACGANTFELTGLRREELPEPHTPTTYTDEDYEAGGMLYFEYPYTPEPDLNQARAQVRCTGCGAEHYGDWDWC